jgi:hypothetical protein
VNSFVQTFIDASQQGIQTTPLFIKSNKNWAMDANTALAIAIENKFDGLVFVDPEASWSSDLFIDLCKTDKDAVAVPLATRAGFEISFGEIARLQEDEKTGEIKVQLGSLGFFYLSSYALEQLSNTHATITYMGREIKLVLQSGDIYSSYHTHEEVLAYRLRELGIEIWANPNHTAFLNESIEYTNDFATLLSQIKANG